METKEFEFSGMRLNGFLMLFVNLAIYMVLGALVATAIMKGNAGMPVGGYVISAFITLVVAVIISCGFVKIEPNEARVMMFFGTYEGTFRKVGYHWVNPCMSTSKLSMRARNLDAQPIKVNDKTGNPVLIGTVVVWRLKDTYKAMFDIDAQTMAEGPKEKEAASSTSTIMNAFESFVRIQSDAATRQVAGRYAYDDNNENDENITLRDGGDVINEELKSELEERLAMAGIEIIEARVNYLAYAPEIAAVMLRRQQATAILAAREKIVEGAVSMVKMALDKLSEENIVDLDDEKKAAMVSNLLVVLCGDDNAQPVVNTGTLNH
ncbi:MAG: SPFH domain-containing protein [Bacteroidaceae bacterium]|nr:SPFH domain-containing protein [Bacteroidaceae bacterium]